MGLELDFGIVPQPDDTTCGPSCLCAVYRYFGDTISLEQTIAETKEVEGGGTLAPMLACHALRRAYRATIYPYNLNVFDPTWFGDGPQGLPEKLRRQAEVKPDRKLHLATDAYLEFLSLGGRLRFFDLTTSLVRRYLRRDIPILTGLSATYLYRCARETSEDNQYDDIRGEPAGHFVVLCGYDSVTRHVLVADPLFDRPAFPGHQYEVSIDRLVGAILLGVLTYDANLLILEPRRGRQKPGSRHRASAPP